MIMTVSFEEKDGRTTLTVHTLVASRDMKAAHIGAGFEDGFNSGPDQLADVVRVLG
jgi:hypothetical protein